MLTEHFPILESHISMQLRNIGRWVVRLLNCELLGRIKFALLANGVPGCGSSHLY